MKIISRRKARGKLGSRTNRRSGTKALPKLGAKKTARPAVRLEKVLQTAMQGGATVGT